jgi:hypothetical protein
MTSHDEAAKEQLFKALQADGKKNKTITSGRHSRYMT